MKIAVLSGKGGTGKTFISVNLARAADNATYVDCDVEEPNGHLFFKPKTTKTLPISVLVPQVDNDKCTACRKCVDFCKYNALALTQNKLMIFYEICHSCGGCALFCPEKALTEKEREVGKIEVGTSKNVTVLTGCLNTGEVSGVPIIKKLMEKLPLQEETIIDCPPGSACVVMESIRGADFCILVAEPTLFGVHNLAMIYELVTLFQIPFGVVINKFLPGENPAQKFCAEHKINILAQIPFDEELGSLNSKGYIAVDENKKYHELFQKLLKTIESEVAK
ncbi:MAG: 4Fe-4S binding protein [Bacteroidales bacterium]|jgi:MinD superfamily P-loop ATPase|nr:4Fe-4S binding protein [Bacteroidales bacterium]